MQGWLRAGVERRAILAQTLSSSDPALTFIAVLI